MIKFIDKTKGLIAPLLLVLALTNQGFAQNKTADTNQTIKKNTINSRGLYGALGFSTAKINTTEGWEDVTFGILGRVGYNFNEYIGVEGRVLKTMWEYEQQKIEHMGLFVKPMFPVSKDIDIYATLGFGKVETGHKIEFDDTGLAWGLGLNYNFKDEKSKRLGIFIDYERLLEKSNVSDFDVLSLGVTYYF